LPSMVNDLGWWEFQHLSLWLWQMPYRFAGPMSERLKRADCRHVRAYVPVIGFLAQPGDYRGQ
jgi:hypothetical protein